MIWSDSVRLDMVSLFRLQSLDNLFDIVEHLVTSGLFLGTCDKVGWQFLPGLFQFGHIDTDILFRFYRSQFVSLRKYDTERHAAFAKPLDEVEVVLLRIVAHINEHKHVDHRSEEHTSELQSP